MLTHIPHVQLFKVPLIAFQARKKIQDLDGLGQDLLRVLAVREGLREDRVGARARRRRGLLGVAVEAQVLSRELDALLRALAFAK